MATEIQTVDFILAKLRHKDRFSARAMFGEFALYADGKVVALICDDRLFVKIVLASKELETRCEQGPPYKGAKPHYIVDEGHLSTMDRLPTILLAIAESMPAKAKRPKTKKAGRKSVRPSHPGEGRMDS